MVTAESAETHIDRLRLTNFRLFAELDIGFDSKLTVLVAPNGGGKTAVLDGIAVALRPLVSGLEQATSRGIDRVADVRRVLVDGKMHPRVPVHVNSHGILLGESFEWGRTLANLKGARTIELGAGSSAQTRASTLMGEIGAYADGTLTYRPTLPLIAYYGTGRLWAPGTAARNKKRSNPTPGSPSVGYTDALSPTSRFAQFVEWFRDYAFEADQERSTQRPSPHNPRLVLAAVQRAVADTMGTAGWTNLEWDFTEKTVRAHHRDFGHLPVGMLSDGIRTMLGLVGDLARRAILVNGHLGIEALSVPGIVLVDEVDLHLHPKWQQVVIEMLRAAFPRVQFIVTTHSPQVLSTVPRRCIRVIEQGSGTNWLVRTPDEQTEGVGSALVLASVMGVDATPDNEHVRRLRAYGSLIGAGHADRDDARALRALLDKHFGPQSAVMLEFDRVIRLEEMKRRLLRREGA